MSLARTLWTTLILGLLAGTATYVGAYAFAQSFLYRVDRVDDHLASRLAVSELQRHARTVSDSIQAHRLAWVGLARSLADDPSLGMILAAEPAPSAGMSADGSDDASAEPDDAPPTVQDVLAALGDTVFDSGAVASLELFPLDGPRIAYAGHPSPVRLPADVAASPTERPDTTNGPPVLTGDVVLPTDRLTYVSAPVRHPETGVTVASLRVGFPMENVRRLLLSAGRPDPGSPDRAFLWGPGTTWLLARGPVDGPDTAQSALAARADLRAVHARSDPRSTAVLRVRPDIAVSVRIPSPTAERSQDWTLVLYRGRRDLDLASLLLDPLRTPFVSGPLLLALFTGLVFPAAGLMLHFGLRR